MWLTVSRWFGANKILVGIIGGALLLSGIGFAIWKVRDAGYEAGKAKVQQAWDADKLARMVAYSDLLEKTRRREQVLTEQIASTQQEKADALASIAADYRRLSDSLRDRPRRPADMSDPAARAANGEGEPGYTGAELYFEDGQFLAGEAARGDTLRTELLACYAQYDAVRRTVNGDAP